MITNQVAALATWIQRTLTNQVAALATWVQRTLFVLALDQQVASDREIAVASDKQVPRWHYAMMNDITRNDAFKAALKAALSGLGGKGTLDIGTGAGLLTLIACQAGADWVVSCEAVPPIADAAREIVRINGFADKATIIAVPSFELDARAHLPRPADILVTETVDCGLVGEGILPIVRHARNHLLAPKFQIIPANAKVFCRLIESEAIHQLNFANRAAGFDVTPFNRFSTRGYFPCRLRDRPHRFLSEPIEVLTFDFARDPLTPHERMLTVRASADGLLHGVAFWWVLTLGPDITLTNSPENRKTHWYRPVSSNGTENWNRGCASLIARF